VSTSEEEFSKNNSSGDDGPCVKVRFHLGGTEWEEIISTNTRYRRLVVLGSKSEDINDNHVDGNHGSSTLNEKSGLKSQLIALIGQHKRSLTSNSVQVNKDRLSKLSSSVNLPSATSIDRSNGAFGFGDYNDSFLNRPFSNANIFDTQARILLNRRSHLLDILRADVCEPICSRGKHMHTVGTSVYASYASSVTNGSKLPRDTINDSNSAFAMASNRSSLSNKRDALLAGLFATATYALLPFGLSAPMNLASSPNQQSSSVSPSKHNSVIVTPTQTIITSSRMVQSVPRGVAGLFNLGNTCYMNSALQCLCRTPHLAPYFLSGQFKRDINRTNILGNGGRVADEFALLMQQIWQASGKSAVTLFGQNGVNSHVSAPLRVVSPIDFKRALQRGKSQFSGHDQQDAQEFLAELIDALHEDLNRFDRARAAKRVQEETDNNIESTITGDDVIPSSPRKRATVRNHVVMLSISC
jgi:hypothetical protein